MTDSGAELDEHILAIPKKFGTRHRRDFVELPVIVFFF